MKHIIRTAPLALLLAAGTANADPKHTLVLKSDGNASADAKSKVDSQVLKLAKSLGGNVEAGEISYTDATAAVGCTPSESSCKDQVLATLGVDEVVITTVSNAPGGELKVTVRLVAKTGMPKEQSTLIPAGQSPDAKLDADIGPMLGAPAVTERPVATTQPPPPPPTSSAASAGAALGSTMGGGDTTTAPVVTTAPTTNTTPATPITTGQADTVTAAPNGQVMPPEGHTDHKKLELTGMAVGGGLVVLSFVMWAEASSTQSDIDSAPTKTLADLHHLQDLESQGDAYSGLGNIMFIGGVGLAAVSTYFWWRDRRADHGQQARLAPTVLDHGAGVVLSFGGGL